MDWLALIGSITSIISLPLAVYALFVARTAEEATRRAARRGVQIVLLGDLERAQTLARQLIRDKSFALLGEVRNCVSDLLGSQWLTGDEKIRIQRMAYLASTLSESRRKETIDWAHDLCGALSPLRERLIHDLMGDSDER